MFVKYRDHCVNLVNCNQFSKCIYESRICIFFLFNNNGSLTFQFESEEIRDLAFFLICSDMEYKNYFIDLDELLHLNNLE